MTYAVLYAENSDIVSTYSSFDAAALALAQFVNQHPEVQDEIGLRPYEDGRPSGPFQTANEVLGDQLAQRPLQV